MIIAALGFVVAWTQDGQPAFGMTPFQVAEPERLALTPRLDGVISDEEWDPLIKVGEGTIYFQWEPSRLHVASTMPVGQAAVLSIDLKGDGWLVGRDNLELRIERKDGVAAITGRVLDATDSAGPRWLMAPGFAMASAVSDQVSADGQTWTFEASIQDPGTAVFRSKPGRLMMRADLINADSAMPEPYVPRQLAPLQLGWQRMDGLPSGVTWGTQGVPQMLIPGETLRLRLNLVGGNGEVFDRINFRSEGFAREGTTLLEQPMRPFDSHNRTWADYASRIQTDSIPGYRLVRATINSADGGVAMTQVSFRVAPLVDIDLVPERITSKEDEQIIKLSAYVRSNGGRRQSGLFHVLPPEGFTVVSGDGKPFTVYPRNSSRKVCELRVPGGARGTYAFSLRVDLGEKSIERPAFLTIH